MKCKQCKSEEFIDGSCYVTTDDQGNKIKVHECYCRDCGNIVVLTKPA